MAEQFPMEAFLQMSKAIADKRERQNPDWGSAIGGGLAQGINQGIEAKQAETAATNLDFKNTANEWLKTHEFKDPQGNDAQPDVVMKIAQSIKSKQPIPSEYKGYTIGPKKDAVIATQWVKDANGEYKIQPVTDASGKNLPGNIKPIVSPDAKVGEYFDPNDPEQRNKPHSSLDKPLPMTADQKSKGNMRSNAIIAYNDATPQQKELAKAYYEGRIKNSNLSFADKTLLSSLANEYAKINNLQPFVSYEGDVKEGMAKNTAYGKMGINALSFDTAIKHAGSAYNTFQKMDNTDVNLLNKPINWLKANSNDPNIITLEADLTALQGELATAFKGTAGTDQEIGKWANALSPSMTAAQFKAVLPEISHLLGKRISAVEYQRGNVMNEPIAGRSMISPESQKVLDDFSKVGQEQSPQIAQTAKPQVIPADHIALRQFISQNQANPDPTIQQKVQRAKAIIGAQ